MPCDCQAEVLAEIADLKAMLSRLLPPPEPEPPQICGPSLSEALAAATAGDWFTSAEAWRLSQGTAPDLGAALASEGIRTSHGLGRWLARQDGDVERGGSDHGWALWRVRGFAEPETPETP